jgi:hypothetical protein
LKVLTFNKSRIQFVESKKAKVPESGKKISVSFIHKKTIYCPPSQQVEEESLMHNMKGLGTIHDTFWGD